MITVENLTKNYGGVAALEGCGLTIEEGTITGLIGPNGAGKSTLFDIIAGAQAPDGGRVHYTGQDITGMAPHRLFHLGLVRTFQVPHEFAAMSVRENLMLAFPGQNGENLFTAWLRPGMVAAQDNQARAKAGEVMEFLKLSEVGDLPAGALSGGQKKLLELGRTMMCDATMVLLDEPGAGVNPTLMGALRDAILRLNRERGYTFCIIEHDMDLVAAMCDPVIVLSQGKVLAQGSWAEIRADQTVLQAYFGSAQP